MAGHHHLLVVPPLPAFGPAGLVDLRHTSVRHGILAADHHGEIGPACSQVRQPGREFGDRDVIASQPQPARCLHFQDLRTAAIHRRGAAGLRKIEVELPLVARKLRGAHEEDREHEDNVDHRR
jgi:hypothetical protein